MWKDYVATKTINNVTAYTLRLILNEVDFDPVTRMATLDFELSLESHQGFSFSKWNLGYDVKVGGITIATSAPFSFAIGVNQKVVLANCANGNYVKIPQGENLPVTAYIETSTAAYYLPGPMKAEGFYSTTMLSTQGSINCDGVMKPGRFWIKDAGIWKQGTPWIKANGKWNK